MEDILLYPMTRADEDGIKVLYESSFPVEERRPWPEIGALHDGDARFTLYVLRRGGERVGMISVWRFDGFRYVEHFAVEPSMRGTGIGRRAIDRLISIDSSPVVLEVEPPVGAADDMTRRRVRFYEGGGFSAFPLFHYVQPPYAPGLPSVRLMLMSTSPGIDLLFVRDTLHRCVYGVDDIKD